MKMTSEQWNGLVALMRAIVVSSSSRFGPEAMEAKRQAGACEANVRKMFVDGEDAPAVGADLDRLLLVTGEICAFLDKVRTGVLQHQLRTQATVLQNKLELARVGARQADDVGKTEAQKDTGRATRAARMIVDERTIGTEAASIMVTLEHTVAAVLLALYDDPRKAAGMLNEALAPGIERRLMDYLNKRTDQ